MVCVIWIVIAASVSADSAFQQDTAILRIRVTAPPAPADAAISVTIRVREDTTPPRTANLRPGSGWASFAGLDPGTYSVTVNMAGVPAASMTVELGLREVVTLQTTPATANPADTRIELLNRQRLGEGAAFGERWLQDLPAGDSVWSVVETAVPFVIADRMDNGGLGTGRSALMGSRGSSWTTTSVSFGDMRLLAPNLVGLIPFAQDLTAMSGLTVTSGLADIEADTPGVLISLTPKRPHAGRDGSLQSSFTEPRMVDLNPLPDAPSIARLASWRDVSAQLSGPVGTRTGLLVSGAFSRAQQYERDRPGIWTSERASVFGHMVTRPGDLDQVRVIAALQRVSYPFDDRRQFRDVNVTERGTFGQSSATWDRVDAGGSRIGATLAFQRSTFRPDVTNPEGGTVDRVTEGVVPAPASAMVTTQWEAGIRFAPRLFTWRQTAHELRTGITARREVATTDVLALPTVAEQVGGVAARVWVPAAASSLSRRTAFHGAAYVGDRIAIGSHLTVDAGLRADLSSGSARGATNGVTWRSLSPRVSFQWSRGPVAIFGGVGRYADPLTLSLLGYGDPGEPVSDVHRWLDLNNDRRFDSGELGVLVSRRGRGSAVATIERDLRAPRTLERTVGLELRYHQLMTLRGAAIWRNQSSMLGSINTGVPASSYRLLFVQDQFTDWDSPVDDQPLGVYDRLPGSFGQDAFLLTNPDDGTAKYEGVEVTWELKTRRLTVLFGAMAYRTRSWSGHLGFRPLENDHSVIGTVFEDPNARPVLQGSSFFDRSYVGKWSTSYRAPGDVRIGFSARYQDGQPFSRVVVVPDLAGGAEMVHAYRTGRTRFTYTLTLDVRIEKGFSLWGHRSALRVDVFNATRHRNEVEEDVLTTPQFRRSTAVQPPLTVRLGFSITF